jgi:hypothetical protein
MVMDKFSIEECKILLFKSAEITPKEKQVIKTELKTMSEAIEDAMKYTKKARRARLPFHLFRKKSEMIKKWVHLLDRPLCTVLTYRKRQKARIEVVQDLAEYTGSTIEDVQTRILSDTTEACAVMHERPNAERQPNSPG